MNLFPIIVLNCYPARRYLNLKYLPDQAGDVHCPLPVQSSIGEQTKSNCLPSVNNGNVKNNRCSTTLLSSSSSTSQYSRTASISINIMIFSPDYVKEQSQIGLSPDEPAFTLQNSKISSKNTCELQCETTDNGHFIKPGCSAKNDQILLKISRIYDTINALTESSSING
ncbi:hypothetical protein GJ496_009293 [Pomphorhynchus laevis]|nr:hypothetical protein GJ496_009293 [Pomphorhynchus laevis]